MNIKKIISLLLLAGTVLTQVPVLGMENGGRRQREERRLEANLHRSRLKAALMGVAGTAFLARVAYVAVKNGPMFIVGALLNPVTLAMTAYSVGTIAALNIDTQDDVNASAANLRPLARRMISPIVHVNNMAATLATNLSNVDTIDNEGKTSLMHAICDRNMEVATRILSRGASLEIKDNQQKNALMHAIDADDIEMVRMLLAVGAEKKDAFRYLRSEMGRYYREISERQLAGAAANANRLAELNEDFAILKKIKQLFEADFAQLISPLTEEQKAEYKKMFLERDKVRPSLHGSLMLYEFFGEKKSLCDFLKDGIAFKDKKLDGIRDLHLELMSYVRSEPKVEKIRLENTLRKAIIEKDAELMELLAKYGINIPLDEKIALQFN